MLAGCQFGEPACRQVDLEGQVPAAVGHVGVIRVDDEVEGVRAAHDARDGKLRPRHEVGEVGDQFDADGLAAAVRQRHALPGRQRVLVSERQRESRRGLLDVRAEVDGEHRAEDRRRRIRVGQRRSRHRALPDRVADADRHVQRAAAHEDTGRPAAAADVVDAGGQSAQQSTRRTAGTDDRDSAIVGGGAAFAHQQVAERRARDPQRCIEARSDLLGPRAGRLCLDAAGNADRYAGQQGREAGESYDGLALRRACGRPGVTGQSGVDGAPHPGHAGAVLGRRAVHVEVLSWAVRRRASASSPCSVCKDAMATQNRTSPRRAPARRGFGPV